MTSPHRCRTSARCGADSPAPVANSTSARASAPIPTPVVPTARAISSDASRSEQPRQPINTPIATSIAVRDDGSLTLPTSVTALTSLFPSEIISVVPACRELKPICRKHPCDRHSFQLKNRIVTDRLMRRSLPWMPGAVTAVAGALILLHFFHPSIYGDGRKSSWGRYSP
jgi:hypothetical protein